MSTAFTPFRRILAVPGAARFSLAALVGRLPISMVGLGIVLLVEDATGSYGLAGTVSATGLVANAAAAVPQGRLIDRVGQARLLSPLIVVWGVALGLLAVAVEADWPLWTAYLLAALAGLSLPPVGSCVRTRWAHVLPEDRDRQTAFALEAAADETVFITGPILVTVLATMVDPALGIGAAVLAGVSGTLVFASLRASEPPPHPRLVDRRDREPMPWLVVVPLGITSIALGSLFGSAEVTTVAFAEERGQTAWSGVLLALWAAGSLVAGILTGTVTWRRPVVERLRWGAAAMALTMAPLSLVGSVPLMGVVLLAGGLAIAPTLIATISLAEQVVPPSRLTEGLALLHTGIVAGVAPGAALAGTIVDVAGASPAYLVSLGGGVLALVAAMLTRPVLATREGERAVT